MESVSSRVSIECDQVCGTLSMAAARIPDGLLVCRAVWGGVQRIVADDSALRLRCGCDCRSIAALYQDIKGVFTRFRSLGGGFEVVCLL